VVATTLKAIKSSMIADFIHVDNKGIVITTNNVASSLDLQEIKKYVKNSLSSDADKVLSVRLPQSKSYLKIVGISFISKKTNSHITLDEIEDVLKNNFQQHCTYLKTSCYQGVFQVRYGYYMDRHLGHSDRSKRQDHY